MPTSATFFVFDICLVVKMAARAGIKPDQPIWLSLAILYRAEGYGGREMAKKPIDSASSGELFTVYAPGASALWNGQKGVLS